MVISQAASLTNNISYGRVGRGSAQDQRRAFLPWLLGRNTRARAPGSLGGAPLLALNLIFEKQRVFWRLAQRRDWISHQQLFFIVAKVDESGRMVGAWLKSLPK